MHKQEIFDTIVAHLRNQGKKAANGSTVEGRGQLQCKYRSDDGLKCAVGYLIPDDRYAKEMEGQDPFGLAFMYPDAMAKALGEKEMEIWRESMSHDEQRSNPEFIEVEDKLTLLADMCMI